MHSLPFIIIIIVIIYCVVHLINRSNQTRAERLIQRKLINTMRMFSNIYTIMHPLPLNINIVVIYCAVHLISLPKKRRSWARTSIYIYYQCSIILIVNTMRMLYYNAFVTIYYYYCCHYLLCCSFN